MNRGQLLRLCQIQQETGPSSVKSSLQRDGGQIWTGERHFHPREISRPLFYVLGHKDQVKHYHNKHYRGKWCSIILRDSSPDIRHHSHVDSGLPGSHRGTSSRLGSLRRPTLPFLGCTSGDTLGKAALHKHQHTRAGAAI